MSNLPEGWVKTTIAEVATISTGSTPTTKVITNFGGITPFVKPSDLNDYFKTIVSAEQTLSDEGVQQSRLLRPGAVLVSCIGNLGKVGITAVPVVTNQQINAVEFESSIVFDRYGYYYCKTLKPWMIKNASSTTISILNKSRFSNAVFLIAPLNEQKRIADKLDSILARVDACRERLDRIPAILKRFRQAVLAAATSGKLTEEWRNTNCVTQTWTKVKLTDVGDLNRGKSKHRPRNDPRLFGGTYPFIQTGDIAQSDGKITTHHQTYSEFGLSQSKLWPSGTVCITIAANIADTAILTYPVCFPDSVVGFIADPGKCVPEFIKWSIDVISEHIESFAPATAQKNINLGILNEIYFLCPSIEEQTEIVRRVEELFAYADRIEARYHAARAQVDKLTPAILAKAFRGELVPQDPNDEPASVLLERIRASRAENAATPKPKRSRAITSRKTPDIG